MPRKLSFSEACARYPHRFTLEHIPSWVREQRFDGTYYAPQYRSDREWYDNTIFPGEPGNTGTTYCISKNQSWPLGHALPSPFSPLGTQELWHANS